MLNRNATVENLHKGSVPVDVYTQMEDKVRELEYREALYKDTLGNFGNIAIEDYLNTKKDKAQLELEIARLEGELKGLRGSFKQQIEDKEKAHRDGYNRATGKLNKQLTYTQAEVKVYTSSNAKLTKENKQLAQEIEALNEINKELTQDNMYKDRLLEDKNIALETLSTLNIKADTTHTKLDTIGNQIVDVDTRIATNNEYVVSMLRVIRESLLNGVPRAEVVETVEEIEESLDIDSQDTLDRDIAIARDLVSGLKKKDVANKYFKNRKQPASALSKRLKVKRFNSLLEYLNGNTTEVPEVYKDLL